MIALLFNKWTYVAIAFAALVAWGGWQKWSAIELENANVKLVVENRDLKGQVAAEKMRVGLAQKAIAALEASAVLARQRTLVETEIAKEIEKAPASDDGPVAPVLKRTLDRIDEITGAGHAQ